MVISCWTCMERKIEMTKKPRCTAIGSIGLGMKTTINKSLLIKEIANSTHALHGVTSAKTQLCKKHVQSEASFTPRYCTEKRNFETHIYYSVCSKANGKDDKEEAVPCDDEEYLYLIIRIRLQILWYSKMHCRRGERWHNGEQGRYSERGGRNKIQGMKMEQQKQQKASEKIYGINKINSKITKAKAKQVQFLVNNHHHNKDTNKKCPFCIIYMYPQWARQ